MQWHEKVKKFDLPDLINVAVVYEKLGMAAHLSRRDSVIAAQHVEVGRRRVDPAGVLQQDASVVADAERPARKIRRVSRKKKWISPLRLNRSTRPVDKFNNKTIDGVATSVSTRNDPSDDCQSVPWVVINLTWEVDRTWRRRR